MKNIFSNQIKKVIKSNPSKFCGICQEAFAKDKDNFKDNYCADCTTHGRIANAAFWKKQFMVSKANSLPPDMAALAAKLSLRSENSVLTRAPEVVSERSIGEIQKSKISQTASFDIVKEQVSELLPPILASMGLANRVDVDLLVDAIVPLKINAYISDPLGGRAALQSIVHETLENLNMGHVIQKEAAVRPHGQSTVVPEYVLEEGIRRVSSDYGNRTRSIKRVAEEAMNVMPGEEAPPTEMSPQDAAGGDFAPPAEAETGEAQPQDDATSKVVHLPDEEADELVAEKAGLGAPEQQLAGVMDQMPNEGIATLSGTGGENMTPDASEVMPEDSVKRVENTVADLVSRKLTPRPVEKPQPRVANLDLFSFAGKLAKKLPVQMLHLAQKDLDIIGAYQPVNHVTAAYSDGSQRMFKYYATDSGLMFVSSSFSAHADNIIRFAEFIETDPTFSKWAFLPPDMAPEEGPMAEEHSTEEMSIPEMPAMDDMGGPIGQDDPGFNDVPETYLNPSPDNTLGGGLAEEQEKIFDNGDPDANRENQLLDTATDFMPHIESSFPDETPEAHMDMAISAALHYLTKKAEDLATPIGKAVGEGVKDLARKVPGGNAVADHFNGPTVRDPGTGYGIFEPGDKSRPGGHPRGTMPRPSTSPAQRAKPVVNPNRAIIAPPGSGNAAAQQGYFMGTTQPSLNPAAPVTPAIHSTTVPVLPPAPQRALPGGQQKALPPGQPMAAAAALTKKANELLPYIDDMYADEPVSVRQALALDAAFNLLKTAEPVMAPEAPVMPSVDTPAAAAPAPVATPPAGGRGGVGVKKQQAGPDKMFPIVNPQHMHNMVKELGNSHPNVAAISGDPQKSMELAQHLSNGHYPAEYFGNESTNGPKLQMPESLFGRLSHPSKRDRLDKQLAPHMYNWYGKVNEHANQLANGEVDSNDTGGSTPAGQVIQKFLDKTRKMGEEHDAQNPPDIPQMGRDVPLAKEHNIDELKNQMNTMQNPDGTPKSTQDTYNTLENFHDSTPHMSPEERVSHIPPHLHGQWNDALDAIKRRDSAQLGEGSAFNEDYSQPSANPDINRGVEKSIEKGQFSPGNRMDAPVGPNDIASDQDLHDVRKKVRDDKFHGLGDQLLPGLREKNEGKIEHKPSVLDMKRTPGADEEQKHEQGGAKAVEKSQEADREKARSKSHGTSEQSRNRDKERSLGETLRHTPGKSQSKRLREEGGHKVKEILTVTADMSSDEFELISTSLLEMGYNESDILTAYADLITKAEEAHRFTDKEHRQEKHIQDSEEESGKSSEEAEDIGWATVNKQKHEGSKKLLIDFLK